MQWICQNRCVLVVRSISVHVILCIACADAGANVIVSESETLHGQYVRDVAWMDILIIGVAAAMGICSRVSGERLCVISLVDGGEDRILCGVLKKEISDILGISRFRQRLFVGNDAMEILDEAKIYTSSKVSLLQSAFHEEEKEMTHLMMWCCVSNQVD